MARKNGFDQIKYQNEFNKQNYDRITLLVPKGEKELIKEKAAAVGKSVSAFLYDLVMENIK